jgi:hypothetical protein
MHIVVPSLLRLAHELGTYPVHTILYGLVQV